MNAKDLISDSLPRLIPSDSVGTALGYMDNFKVSHLPVVNGTEYLGVVAETDLYGLNDNEVSLEKSQITLYKSFVRPEQHFLEILGVASSMNLSVVPIVGEDNKYEGSLLTCDLVKMFTKLSSLTQPGAIIELSVSQRDYSMSQISQIIEGNDIKILGIFVSTSVEPSVLDITIKVNVTDIVSLIRTFERYGYDIKSWVSTDETIDQFYTERFDILMKYLNI